MPCTYESNLVTSTYSIQDSCAAVAKVNFLTTRASHLALLPGEGRDRRGGQSGRGWRGEFPRGTLAYGCMYSVGCKRYLLHTIGVDHCEYDGLLFLVSVFAKLHPLSTFTVFIMTVATLALNIIVNCVMEQRRSNANSGTQRLLAPRRLKICVHPNIVLVS